MSHFLVFVIGKNIEKQLEPYWELDLNLDQLQEDYRSKFVCEIDVKNVEEEFKIFSEDEKNKRYKYKNYKEWISDYHGYFLNKEGTSYGYYHNPNSKWDWYVVGGRWANFLKLKNGKYSNSAKKCEIDIDSMRKESADRSLKTYKKFHEVLEGREIPEWKEVLEKCKNDKEKARDVYNKNQVIIDINKFDPHFLPFNNYKSYLKTEEDFYKDEYEKSIVPYALVIDSKWYEKGTMGWWGISTNEKEQTDWNKQVNDIINNISDDTLITVVDCHI